MMVRFSVAEVDFAGCGDGIDSGDVAVLGEFDGWGEGCFKPKPPEHSYPRTVFEHIFPGKWPADEKETIF